ncbi:MAG: septum site-determining protein MinC [Lachnospiraceae bacterium]|nr:septum site-determining protein MinC [Lachnospiraceae bacterium]
MKETVVIKSYHNGITMMLKDDVPFHVILDELALKLSGARNFFGEAKVALSFEGRSLTKEEEIEILDTIHENSDIEIICIVGKDEETDKLYLRAIRQSRKRLIGSSDGQFYKGSLKNREVLETETSIVILGDVYPGCKVISRGNIIVLGGLYGEAYAGATGEEDHTVVALEMEPEKLKIGDFKYKSAARQKKWGMRPKIQPKIAYVKNERIVFDALTKDLFSGFR